MQWKPLKESLFEKKPQEMAVTIFRQSQFSPLSLPTCDDPFFDDLFCVSIAAVGMHRIYLVMKYQAKNTIPPPQNKTKQNKNQVWEGEKS